MIPNGGAGPEFSAHAENEARRAVLILRNPSAAARRLLTAAQAQVLLDAIEETGGAS
jgi:hypothetical protein